MGQSLEELKPTASLSFCESTQKRVHGCVFDSRFGLYHVAVVLSCLRSISLAVNFNHHDFKLGQTVLVAAGSVVILNSSSKVTRPNLLTDFHNEDT